MNWHTFVASLLGGFLAIVVAYIIAAVRAGASFFEDEPE